ncbi:MAG: twin-arginine translocase TatA/TatE family subunit [Bacteroidota bacterium]
MASLLFLDISFGEIFIIIVAIFIIFGPDKIPELARKFGKGMREIKKASTDIRREFNQEVNQYKTDLDLEKMATEADKPAKDSKTEETTPSVEEKNKKDKSIE